jgi:hypothetical protein
LENINIIRGDDGPAHEVNVAHAEQIC